MPVPTQRLQSVACRWSSKPANLVTHRMSHAIGRFQTGTFLQGCADAEESSKEAMLGAKYLLRKPASSKQCESLQRR